MACMTSREVTPKADATVAARMTACPRRWMTFDEITGFPGSSGVEDFTILIATGLEGIKNTIIERNSRINHP